MIGACAVAHEEIVVLATEHGYAKRTAVDEFPVQARGGSGLKAAKIDKAAGRRSRRSPRPSRSPSSRKTARSSRLRAPYRAAARDGGGSKVAGVDGALLRVVVVSSPAAE